MVFVIPICLTGGYNTHWVFVSFPNQACLWGSYNKERISVRVGREGRSPVALGPVPPKILVPSSWYQDFGTQKTESLRGGASQKVSRGERGAAGPPARGSAGWKPPRNSRGSGGQQPPSKNNFMDPEPSSDHLQPLPTICQPPSTTFLPPSTTYRPPSPSTTNHYHF